MFNNKLTPWKYWGTDKNHYYFIYLYRTKVLCKLNITGSRRSMPNEMTWVNTKLRWHDTLYREYFIPITATCLSSFPGRRDALQYCKHSTKCSVSSYLADLRPPAGVASIRPGFGTSLCLASPHVLRPSAWRRLRCLPLAVPVSLCPLSCPSPRLPLQLMCLPYISC